MRRLSSALALISVTALLAACTSSADAGWTYAPAPSVTPAPQGRLRARRRVGEPSEAPTATPEESESAEPSETGEPSESAERQADRASRRRAGRRPQSAASTRRSSRRPRTRRSRSTFDNQDTGVPHNFVLKNPDGTNVDIGDTAFFNGPETTDLRRSGARPRATTRSCARSIPRR